MNRNLGRTLLGTTWLACAFMLTAPVAPAHADATTEKLIQILVQNGVLRKDQAAALLAQAQQEAASGMTSVKPANAPEAPPKLKPGTVRVVYIPEVVRNQIAAEVKQQVMQQAMEEGWAEPNQTPSWIQQIKISGDIRIRGSASLYDPGNANTFPDFNSINSSSNGYDASGNSGLPPFLNTTQNRERMQLRARLDIAAHVSDWVDTDFMIATGSDRSPVSTNQTLGGGSGSGNAGDFQKYSIWLDRGDITLHPSPAFKAIFGRGPDVYDVSDLMYDPEVNLDGVSLQSSIPITDRLGWFSNGGAYTLFNTDLNYGEPNLVKSPNNNAYLFAVQTGADYHFTDHQSARLAVGYFSYANVQGFTSALCTSPTAYGSCSTDSTRAPFVQFGNTLMPIRDIAITTSSSSATPQPEYYGLASKFQLLDLHGRYADNIINNDDLVFEGEYIKNLGLDQNALAQRELANNTDPSGTGYSGGNTAYMAKILWGVQTPAKLWDYNASLAYKYLETDSVLDALTDSKFHMGGTNAKGFVLSGTLNVGSNTTLTTSWYSAKQVTGAPYAVDVILTDLMTGF